jgi:cytochrome b6-f complex iron-sulfur subunit
MSKEDNQDKNWKQDFPIKKEQSLQLISRRDFAKFLVFISGGLALVAVDLSPPRRFCSPRKDPTRNTSSVRKSEIPVGGTRSFVIEGDGTPYLMIHLGRWELCMRMNRNARISLVPYFMPRARGKSNVPVTAAFLMPPRREVLAGPPPRALPKLVVVSKWRRPSCDAVPRLSGLAGFTYRIPMSNFRKGQGIANPARVNAILSTLIVVLILNITLADLVALRRTEQCAGPEHRDFDPSVPRLPGDLSDWIWMALLPARQSPA